MANPKKPQPVPVRRPKLWVRFVALIATLFALWHVLASFLWIAPYSENAREAIPQNMLSSYMLPFFGQSWSVFAPEPINGDYHFNVRATLIGDDGKEIETGWVSATDVELSMIRYNLFPPRAGIQSSELASAYKTAFDSLNDEQQATVSGSFTADKWETDYRAALENQPEANQAKVDVMVKEEHRATAYATQVARAIWGDSVVYVQFRVSRQNVIPFKDRNNLDAERPKPQVVLPGWRLPVEEPGQSDENFARTFKAQYERTAQ